MTDRKLAVPDFLKDSMQSALEPLGKLETAARDVLKKVQDGSAVSQKEVKKAIDDLLARVRDARTEVEKSFSEGVAKTLSVLNLPTRDELKKLETKVNKLARDLNTLKPKTAAKKTPKKAAKKKAAKK